jgi:MFS transporter, Spinster family, sphingosine-1-phosphate transporter
MIHSKDAHDAAEMTISRGKANLWFIVILVIYIIDMMDKQAINAVLPVLKSEFDFTDAQLGAISSVVSVSVGLLCLPVAVLIDRWSRRKIIAIMVGLWSFATFLTGRATGFIGLLLARLSVGIGEAGYQPASIALVSAWYPRKMRGAMLGLLTAGAPLGAMAGILMAGTLTYHFGWRACFGILALPGFIFALLAWFIPDYKTVRVEQGKEESARGSLKETILYILKTPTMIYLYLASAAIVMVIVTFSAWGVSFFERTFDLNIKQASTIIGVILLITFPGSLYGGWLGDRLIKRTCRGRLIAALVNGLAFLLFSTLALQVANCTRNLYLVIPLWALSSFFVVGIMSNVYATTQDLAAPYFRATAVGFVPLVQQLLGATIGPIIAGFISDRMGLVSALQIVGVLGIFAGSILIMYALKHYEGDLQRVKDLGTFTLSRD